MHWTYLRSGFAAEAAEQLHAAADLDDPRSQEEGEARGRVSGFLPQVANFERLAPPDNSQVWFDWLDVSWHGCNGQEHKSYE